MEEERIQLGHRDRAETGEATAGLAVTDDFSPLAIHLFRLPSHHQHPLTTSP